MDADALAHLRGRDLPTGTVTFLFADVEGSTDLLHQLGAERYARALSEHRRVLRAIFGAHGGIEVDTQGDAFFVAFPTAPGALAAAADVQEALAAGPMRVRIGIHTGTPLVSQEGYVGADVHRAARIAAAGHGGQVLVSASTTALVGVEGLRDLGKHRLKDLAAAERIYQLGDGEFPPLKSLYQTNLPVPATPFLGRRRELVDLLELASRADVRLVTLTGPGGTGKTRLALQAAGELAERYPHGVWWVPLAPLRDPELVLPTAGQTLGAKDHLADHIGDRSMLVLFDNFEQVVSAAGDLAGLLASCPELHILVTSREPLRMTGEHEYAVPPLVHAEAVDFFVARARAVRRNFQRDDAVAEICRRLDELPLALELAAARAKALSSAQILARLEERLPLLTGGARDVPERQRTLRATIEWSHELLTLEEQRLFARLAVFAGGCTLEAAEAVVDADLDTLQSLVDKSLVRARDGERFWMLETIREFSRERLEASGEDEELRRRHAEYLLARAEPAADSVMRMLADAPEVAWFDAEQDNLRAALDYARTLDDSLLELRLATACSFYWFAREHVLEGNARLEGALARAAGEPRSTRARALLGMSSLSNRRGDGDAALQQARKALELASDLDDPGIRLYGLVSLGVSEWVRGNTAASADHYDEAAKLARSVGDPWYLAMALNNRGVTALEAHDAESARPYLEEAAAIGRELGGYSRTASPLIDLVFLELGQGETDRPGQMLEEAVRLIRDNGDTLAFAWATFVGLAAVWARRGDGKQAAWLLGAAAAREDVGATWTAYASVLEQRDAAAEAARVALGAAEFEEAFEEGRAQLLEDALEFALGSARSLSRGP